MNSKEKGTIKKYCMRRNKNGDSGDLDIYLHGKMFQILWDDKMSVERNIKGRR